ncbi:MAG: metallophosphoesterase [Clostridia bacterium]|nr:metallophosphoesterase [Clostridia bacterium]
MVKLPENLNAHPSVFAIGNNYQIVTPFACSAIVWATVGEKTYYDHCNGILKSNNFVHKIEVPMKELDAVGEYTLCYRKMIDRAPYFPVSEDTVSLTYQFKPVSGDEIRIYHISDAHNMEEEPIEAALNFGKEIDLLVLNGDIPDHSGAIENFNSIYRICSGITQGRIPIIFTRGNHDTRGIYGESFSEYTPTDNGKPYYTFRLGKLWGLVLDCGEDKNDTNAEYSHTVCFHSYRLKQTQWLEDVIEKAEYEDEGIEHRIVISHVPFSYIQKPPFDIEHEIYRHWTDLVSNRIKPDLLLYGHLHSCRVHLPGSDFDAYKLQTCPAVVGGKPNKQEKIFTGCGITLTKGEPEIIFTSNE